MDFMPAGRLASISKQEGVPGGHSLFSFSLPVSGQGKGLPSAAPSVGRVPPAPTACGPSPCPPCAAAVPPPAPSRPCRPCRVMWRPRPRLWRVPAKLAASRCSGAPFRKARPRQAACGGPCFAPPPRRLRRRCSGAARPPRSGGCGAVRASGPVGGASASLASPATPAAQAVPLGSACALAARRSGAAALAASSGQAGPRPAACGLAPAGARNLYRRAQWRRKRRLPRASRAAGRGGTPPAGGSAGRCPGRQGQGKPRAGRQAAHERGPCLPVPRPARANRGGCPALCGPPAPSHSGKRWCFLCLL